MRAFRGCFDRRGHSAAFHDFFTEFVWFLLFFAAGSRCFLASRLSLTKFVVLWAGWVGAFFFFLR